MSTWRDSTTLLWILMAVAALSARATAQEQDAYSQFDLLRAEARYREAEQLARGQKEYFERNAPHEITSIATWARNLGNVYFDEGRYDEAESQFQRALDLAEQHAKIWPPETYDLTRYQIDLAELHMARSRYDLAKPLVLAALRYRQKGQLVDPAVEIAALRRAAGILRQQGLDHLAAEAEKYAAIRPKDEKTRREINTAAVSQSLDQYGRWLLETGNYAEAEKVFLQSLELREDLWGPLQRDVAASHDHLGRLYFVSGHYSKAETRLKKAVSIRQEVLGEDRVETAKALVNQGEFYTRLGRWTDAEGALTAALNIYAQRKWLEHPDAAAAHFVRGTLYAQRGRFAEADRLFRRALKVRKKVFAAEHKSLAQSYDALARLYVQHGRAADAEKLAADSLAIRKKIYGTDHIEVASAAQRLAEVRQGLGDFDEAARQLARSVDIRRKALGAEHPDVAQVLSALARLRIQQGEAGQGEKLLAEALAIQRAKLGRDHEETATTFLDLAELALCRGQHDEAQNLLEEAQAAAASGLLSPQTVSRLKALQADMAWREKDHRQAIELLEGAIAKAEEQRAFAAGAEQEQGALFARFARLYQCLVAWHVELGQTAAAFAAMERSRARSLLDQMALQGADPLAGLQPQERDTLNRKLAQAQLRVAGLTRQLQLLAPAPGRPAEEFHQQRERLVASLVAAQAQVLEAYREVRSASRTIELAGSPTAAPLSLEQAQALVEQRQAALVAYFSTEKDLYRLVLLPGKPPQLERVELSPEAAQALVAEPGRISADRLWSIFRVEGKDLSQHLADPKGLPKVRSRLAALWAVLFPEALRDGLMGEQYRLLIVVPDGPLVRLPLETLVIEPAEDPKFLLDVGPPILYVPSVTVLAQIAGRAHAREQIAVEPVLSVGDPAYQVAPDAEGVQLVSAGSRFASLAGGLSRLPFTAWEMRWVSEVFSKQGAPVVTLTQREATERACRNKMPAREIIHLACHGLCDEASGNLFGALALAPSLNGAIDPADDGFLTLAEVYELNLSGNELAILSACQTNAGPLTRGEGVWALSRGFLVAGSRRVVASNWLVDDEAGASLVSYFCTGLAQSRGTASTDYADALLRAKRAVRQQEKWKSPYFWAGLVLVGPN
jgi:CHAT domain-containing protein/tetratricopeptide (TPR) repeat protein